MSHTPRTPGTRPEHFAFCPNCHERMFIIDTRAGSYYTRRRWRCDPCGHAITTREVTMQKWEEMERKAISPEIRRELSSLREQIDRLLKPEDSSVVQQTNS